MRCECLRGATRSLARTVRTAATARSSCDHALHKAGASFSGARHGGWSLVGPASPPPHRAASTRARAAGRPGRGPAPRLRVHALLHERLALAQQLAGQDDDGRGAVAHLHRVG
jgi:hypothetical protein